MFLNDEIERLEANVQHKDLHDENVSVKGIDWHLDHSYRVIIEICKTLIRSNPDKYKGDFNLARSVVFMANMLPRGKGKAPKAVVSTEEITIESLKELNQKSNELIQDMINLPAHSHFKHPVFGVLDLEMSKQFIKMHTNHHLKIMKEIFKNKG